MTQIYIFKISIDPTVMKMCPGRSPAITTIATLYTVFEREFVEIARDQSCIGRMGLSFLISCHQTVRMYTFSPLKTMGLGHHLNSLPKTTIIDTPTVQTDYTMHPVLHSPYQASIGRRITPQAFEDDPRPDGMQGISISTRAQKFFDNRNMHGDTGGDDQPKGHTPSGRHYALLGHHFHYFHNVNLILSTGKLQEAAVTSCCTTLSMILLLGKFHEFPSVGCSRICMCVGTIDVNEAVPTLSRW